MIFILIKMSAYLHLANFLYMKLNQQGKAWTPTNIEFNRIVEMQKYMFGK